MQTILDFHIHSKYSRATSSDMNVASLSSWAEKKGISVLGTGDFTHPKWNEELKENLEPLGNGLFKLKDSPKPCVYFILTTEISCIYSKKSRVYKVHNVIFAPSFEIVDKIRNRLAVVGNLNSDGRPILGLDSKELLKIVLDASNDCLFVPAHVWTPHFSVFGANSGFDSLEECFEELTPQIYAIETGLSSDPAMNWRLKELDKRAIISSSDAHSPSKLGREATVFDLKTLSYDSILGAIKSKDPNKFLFTIEFYPEEGKYHYTGHRNCNVVRSPEETKNKGTACSVCGRKLTVGVMHRVEELADRPTGFRLEDIIPYRSLVPLEEIIAESLGKQTGTSIVSGEYEKFIDNFGSEFKVLLDTEISDLEKINPRVAEGIKRVREGKVKVSPGYDGVYGKVSLFGEDEILATEPQMSLF